jgi:glycosyltransferase involved in cell wall biosynthesis
VIVVNDGSTDGTADLVCPIEGVRVIRRPRDEGKGAAVRDGIAATTDRSSSSRTPTSNVTRRTSRSLEPVLQDRANVVYGTTGQGRGALIRFRIRGWF